MAKKFLDSNGLTYLVSQLNNYPTNDILSAVIDGIDEAKADKVNASKVSASNHGTSNDEIQYITIDGIEKKITDSNSIKSEAIAPKYSDLAFPISANTLCTYGGYLYKANSNITNNEVFTPNHWTLTTLDNEYVKYVSIIVTCATQDNAAVTNQIVTLRNGLTENSPVYATKEYNGQPITFDVLPGFNYYISVSSSLAGHFSPTVASGVVSSNTSVILTYDDASHITTYSSLLTAIETFDDPTVLVNNVTINDTWTSEDGTVYQDPMNLVAIKNVEDSNGVTHLAGIMQRKYASLRAIQYDAPENEVATEATATEGLYYVGKSGTTYTRLNLAAGATVPYENYDVIYHNAVNFDGNQVQYGYNRWRDGAYRQYLNSDAPIGEWWHSTHVGDKAPSQLNSVRGYMAGCSSALLAVAKPIKINSSLNTVTDGGIMETTIDTFWLPSGIEYYGSSNNSGEGTYFPYWKEATGLSSPSDDSNVGRIHYAIENHSSAQWVRCRSASRYYSYSVWFVHSAGTLNHYSALYAGRAAPACAIYNETTET